MNDNLNEEIINPNKTKPFPLILIYCLNILMIINAWKNYSTFFDSWFLNFSFLIIFSIIIAFLGYLFNLIMIKRFKENRTINRYIINMKHYLLSIIIGILLAIVVIAMNNQTIQLLINSILLVVMFGYLLLYHIF